MRLDKCTREQFVAAISDHSADKFAKTFRAKADMQDHWQYCIGAFLERGVLGGAIITTISKRSPKVANLQLLHTFHESRGNGIASALCRRSLTDAIEGGANYFRVSAEPDAVAFYEKIGFKMLGKQKSGCQLSMFRINGDSFWEGEYTLDHEPIYNAVHKKGKGGCIEVFAANPVGLEEFL